MPKGKTKKIVKKTPLQKQVQTQKQTVHIHMDKSKPTKRKKTIKKEVIQRQPTNYINSSAASNLSHKRGSMVLSTQAPTIIQQTTIDPALKIQLDKLDKRTRKIKEGLKQNTILQPTQPIEPLTTTQIPVQTAKVKKLETPSQPVTGIVETDEFVDALETPSKPKKLNFGKIKEMLSPFNPFKSSNVTDFSKRLPIREADSEVIFGKIQRPSAYPLLEYKEPTAEFVFPPTGATAPGYVQPKTGKVIDQELQELVKQLHAAHPSSKIAIATFRSAISKKLKELGVESRHTNQYVNAMRIYYNSIFDESNNITLAPIQTDPLIPPQAVDQREKTVLPTLKKKGRKKKGQAVEISALPGSIAVTTPATI